VANLVLVHGAWHGAWCWSKLAPLLEVQGHLVLTPDMPGHGQDNTPLSRVTMKRYVRRISETVENLGENVVLVGHSMGGVVISQVAEQIPERIEKLIYLTGFLLQNGQTLFSTMQHEHGQSLSVAAQNGTALEVPDQVFAEVFYSDCTEAERSWAKPQLAAQAALPFASKIAVTEAGFGSVCKAYIQCELDCVIRPDEQAQMIAATPCEHVISVAAGHMAMISQPELLAAAMCKMVSS